MIVIHDLADFRQNLDSYLAKVQDGEDLYLKHTVPENQIADYPKFAFGCMKDQIAWIDDDFNAPLPEEELKLWGLDAPE